MIFKNKQVFFVPSGLMPNATNTNGFTPEGIKAHFDALAQVPEIVEFAEIANDSKRVLIVTDFLDEFTALFAQVNQAMRKSPYNKPDKPTVYDLGSEAQGVAKVGPYVAVRRPDRQVAVTLGAKVPVATVANWADANNLMNALTGCELTFNRSGLDEASSKCVAALLAARHPGN